MRQAVITVFIIFACATILLPGRVWAAEVVDTDFDGLSDSDEVNVWHTDPLDFDTDRDGHPDGVEAQNNYDPLQGNRAKLSRRIVINLKKQELTYEIGPRAVLSFPVSTGKKGYSTPKGTFTVQSKIPRAWSRTYKLWMPYWLNFYQGKYGIHELPEWPNGYKESAKDLGRPISHGCVRLGVDAAKQIYDLAEVGTEILIQ